MFSLEYYNYHLPDELIAQVPTSDRDGSRLLLVDRLKRSLADHSFVDLPSLLKEGDLLVVNNTQVVPARLYGRKGTGGQVEILVLTHQDHDDYLDNTRWCMVKASKRPGEGSILFFENGVSGRVESLGDEGLARIQFSGSNSVDSLLEEKGTMPLPPYIKRNRHDSAADIDRERYQTIFSSRKGAVAAPTAGLHFTEKLIGRLKRAGISVAELTLHVGHGTFRPVRVQDIREHVIGEETFIVEPDTAKAINQARQEGRRIIAVGTTVVRTLESAVGLDGQILPGVNKTDLLITPGYRFKAVDGMVTNFHLPKSSLLFLVSALAGSDLIKKAYNWAVKNRYRFYSYGDAMLII
jgi:S-adenosylmethionine:tRNA ribosyltransferase-isomerase